MKKTVSIALTLLVLSGCSLFSEDRKEDKPLTTEQALDFPPMLIKDEIKKDAYKPNADDE